MASPWQGVITLTAGGSRLVVAQSRNCAAFQCENSAWGEVEREGGKGGGREDID